VLSHEPGAADLTRLNNGAPLLFNHNMDDVIGVVEKAAIGSDKRGHATVRFAKNDHGSDVLSMVRDGVMKNVSFMYAVSAVTEDAKTGDYIATKWTPMEISMVTVPADNSVGVGRSGP
jgi:HK97 family phage prohead protease